MLIEKTKMLEYTRTHPWISFQLDLRRVPTDVWVALGEARSKCQHLAGVPLKPETATLLHQIFLAKGALATTAIEGNTLSEKEVLAIVQKRSELPPSQAYLQQEIENILSMSNAIMDRIESGGATPITVADIKEYNKKVLEGLEVADYVVPGECVKTDVKVAAYHGAPWKECEELLARTCDWLNSKAFSEWDNGGIVTGILRAIIAHLYLVWIHPFGDGNGRTARLLELRFLTESGVPSAAGHLLSNFYNRTRSEYYRKLNEASKSDAGIVEFIKYAVNGFVDELRTQIKVVKVQQWHVSWVNYVYEQYEGKRSVADKRQLTLVLELSKAAKPVPRAEIRRISAAVAEEYAGKTEKTLFRDLLALLRRGLIVRQKDGFRAHQETVLAFLPRARKGDVDSQLKELETAAIAVGQLQLDLH